MQQSAPHPDNLRDWIPLGSMPIVVALLSSPMGLLMELLVAGAPGCWPKCGGGQARERCMWWTCLELHEDNRSSSRTQVPRLGGSIPGQLIDHEVDLQFVVGSDLSVARSLTARPRSVVRPLFRHEVVLCSRRTTPLEASTSCTSWRFKCRCSYC